MYALNAFSSSTKLGCTPANEGLSASKPSGESGRLRGDEVEAEREPLSWVCGDAPGRGRVRGVLDLAVLVATVYVFPLDIESSSLG